MKGARVNISKRGEISRGRAADDEVAYAPHRLRGGHSSASLQSRAFAAINLLRLKKRRIRNEARSGDKNRFYWTREFSKIYR